MKFPKLSKNFRSWVLLAALGASLMWGGSQCRSRDQAEQLANEHRAAALKTDLESDDLRRDLAAAKMAQEKLAKVAAGLRALPRAVTKPEEGHEVEVPKGETVTAKRDSILLSKARAAELWAIGKSEENIGVAKSDLVVKAVDDANALGRAKRRARAWRKRTFLALGVGFVIGYVVGK